MSDENRATARRKILKTAAIEFSGTSLPCVARNVSETGAALEVKSPLWFPDQFTLVIESEALRRGCRIVWRRERRIGVTFQ